ncbi:MAG: MerR family transcriptional regulator [Lachnospiraceae bacterium]|nr:MerR family transcriptional regulator [Lachnospiraceae bacterium]
MTEEKKYLRIGEAAFMVGCSCQTLRNYQRKGILVPEIILESGQRKYSVRQIEKFIQEQMEVE